VNQHLGLIPCIDNPHFIGTGKFKSEKIETAQCQISGKMINIEELRGAVMSKNDIALETIKSSLPGEETALDAFFKIVKLDLGVINAGELLKRLLKYKERKFI
jgi:hypothetical protein